MRGSFSKMALLALSSILSVAGLSFVLPSLALAQQLDLEDLHRGPSHPVQTARPAPSTFNPTIGISSPARTPASSIPSASVQPSSFQPPLATSGIQPLSATISKTLYLPPAMYGQWNVVGTILDTNVQDSRPISTNIWILARDGDRVTITNPDNGASASVNVEAVQDNTATFNKIIKMGRLLNSEKVTITVAGDSFYGKNLMQNQYYQDGRLVRTEYALFQLQGTRISGARVQFKPERTQNGPDIEIENVQHR